jgi:ribosomal-protein-serine acetyltransferase
MLKDPPRQNMELESEGIRLRPFKDSDIDAVYEAIRESIDTIGPWLPFAHPGYKRDEAKTWVESRKEAWEKWDELGFAMENPKTGRLLGICGLNQISHINRLANLGYWVRTSAQGKGVATKATRLLARFGIEELGLERVEILVAVDNHGSRRVAEKAGAFQEGILRRRIYLNDKAHDAMMYSFIRDT